MPPERTSTVIPLVTFFLNFLQVLFISLSLEYLDEQHHNDNDHHHHTTHTRHKTQQTQQTTTPHPDNDLQFGMMKSYLLLDSILGTTFMFFLQVTMMTMNGPDLSL